MYYPKLGFPLVLLEGYVVVPSALGSPRRIALQDNGEVAMVDEGVGLSAWPAIEDKLR